MSEWTVNVSTPSIFADSGTEHPSFSIHFDLYLFMRKHKPKRLACLSRNGDKIWTQSAACLEVRQLARHGGNTEWTDWGHERNLRCELINKTHRQTSSRKRITVLLADDNRLVRTEFRKILELEDDIQVVGEAKNGRQAVVMVKKLRPALVLMDTSMPVLNGLHATRQILEAVPATKVLMLSSHSDDAYVAEAVNSGAKGYLIKQTSSGNVCTAIREVHNGHTFFSPSIPVHLQRVSLKISERHLPAA